MSLLGVTINPEGRVSVDRGAAPASLGQHEWRAFLVKIRNAARVTAALNLASPNAEPTFRISTNQPEPKPGLAPAEVAKRWLDLAWVESRPMTGALSGIPVEYKLVNLYSRDAGPREARLKFDVGAGTQNLGFRGDLDVLFACEAAVPVTLEVLDEAGRPTTAAFTFRDALGRSYPSSRRRLAPDFWFQPQAYRRGNSRGFAFLIDRPSPFANNSMRG